MVLPGVVIALATLSAAEIARLIAMGLTQASGLWTDSTTRAANAAATRASNLQADATNAAAKVEKANEQAFEELRKLFEQNRGTIRPREVRVPLGSFNASSAYTQAFTAAAIIVLVAKVHQIEADLRKIGQNLEKIANHLRTISLAQVQGWSNDRDGFGGYVYRLVEQEIRAQSRKDHYFYVYHPDTVWHSGFENRLSHQPLPASFGGYSNDLDAIFLLMWTNRQTRISEDRHTGQSAVFHLLLPTYEFYAINDRLIIDPSIGPLVIKGYTCQSHYLAHFRFYYLPHDCILQDLGNLHEVLVRRRQERDSRVRIGNNIGGAGFMVGVLTSALCPPAAVVAFPVAVTCHISAFGHYLSCAAMGMLEDFHQPPLRHLGPPPLMHTPT